MRNSRQSDSLNLEAFDHGVKGTCDGLYISKDSASGSLAPLRRHRALVRRTLAGARKVDNMAIRTLKKPVDSLELGLHDILAIDKLNQCLVRLLPHQKAMDVVECPRGLLHVIGERLDWPVDDGRSLKISIIYK